MWATERILAQLAGTEDPRKSGESELESIPYVTLDEIESAPKSVKDVPKSKYRRVWLDAMNKEVEGLERNNTWTAVDAPPSGEKAVDSKWVFQWKIDEHGYVLKAKARLVFRGDRQEIGDIPTFAPTPPTTTNRVAAAVACAEGKTIFHFDVEQAFVQSELEDKIYMRLPPGLGERSGTVVFLRKGFYGLKQAAREWSGKLGKTLKGLGSSRA